MSVVVWVQVVIDEVFGLHCFKITIFIMIKQCSSNVKLFPPFPPSIMILFYCLSFKCSPCGLIPLSCKYYNTSTLAWLNWIRYAAAGKPLNCTWLGQRGAQLGTCASSRTHDLKLLLNECANVCVYIYMGAWSLKQEDVGKKIHF